MITKEGRWIISKIVLILATIIVGMIGAFAMGVVAGRRAEMNDWRTFRRAVDERGCVWEMKAGIRDGQDFQSAVVRNITCDPPRRSE